MVALAIADDSLFALDLCEVERGGITYTADTLEELAQRYEGARLFFIMGTDSAITLPGWKRADDVARLCTIVVAKRPGQSTKRVREALGTSPVDFDVMYLDVPQIDVSSTQLREDIACGRDVSDMIPRPSGHISRGRSCTGMSDVKRLTGNQTILPGEFCLVPGGIYLIPPGWHIEREGFRT